MKNETSKDVLKRMNKRSYLRHRLNIRVVISVVFLAVSLLILYFGIGKQYSYALNKTEKAVADYKVYLNKDDIYTQDYQEAGFSYVSSTIDYVNANFDYELKYDKDVKTEYDYEIKSILTIKEPGMDGKVLYTEDFVELEKKTNLPASNKIIINENLKIDFKKYNMAVENYKKSYGVSVEANVKTVMYVTEKSIYDDKEVFNEVRELSTNIPLGEQTVTIDVNNPINSVDVILGDNVLKINWFMMAIGVLSICLTSLYITDTILVLNKYEQLKTIYDIKLAKILKDYDRIVVESNEAKINQNFKNVISVNEFEELVDARDNTEQPILFIEKEVGKCAEFMVINDNTLYMYELNIKKLK